MRAREEREHVRHESMGSTRQVGHVILQTQVTVHTMFVVLCYYFLGN